MFISKMALLCHARDMMEDEQMTQLPAYQMLKRLIQECLYDEPLDDVIIEAMPRDWTQAAMGMHCNNKQCTIFVKYIITIQETLGGANTIPVSETLVVKDEKSEYRVERTTDEEML